MTRPRNSQAKAYATRRNAKQGPILSEREQWATWWRNMAELVDSEPFLRQAQEYGHDGVLATVIEMMRKMTK